MITSWQRLAQRLSSPLCMTSLLSSQKARPIIHGLGGNNTTCWFMYAFPQAPCNAVSSCLRLDLIATPTTMSSQGVVFEMYCVDPVNHVMLLTPPRFPDVNFQSV
jgi:hypothetical protein